MKFSSHKNFANFSYRFLLITIIFFFTVIPSLVTFSAVMKHIDSVITEKYFNEYINAVEKKTVENMSSCIYEINSLSYFFLTNQSIYNIVNLGEDNYEITYQKLKNEFDALLNSNTIINGITLISPKQTVYNFSALTPPIEYIDSTVIDSIQNSKLYILPHSIQNGEKYYIPIIKRMYNYFTKSEGGFIVMYIDETLFSGIYKNDKFDNDFFLSIDDIIISHSDKSLINSKLFLSDNIFAYGDKSLKTDNGYILMKKSIGLNGTAGKLDMICSISYDSFNVLSDNLYSRLIILIILSVSISFIVSIMLSSKLLREMEILRKNFSKLGKHLYTYKKNFKLKEIKDLENDFQYMTQRINTLITNIEIEQEKQRHAELSALQAQINPHFIYNTLDSVAWLALEENNRKIYNIIYSLANFFRISLSRGSGEITLSKEIEHVKSYLTIEEIRFPNKFCCVYDIDDNLSDIMVTKIILQPLVENSIKHGFDNIETGGIIKISVYRLDENYIELKVSDNGCGTNRNPLYDTSDVADKIGYGLKNVDDRIKLAYGKECGLTFESVPNVGTIVKIKIKTKKTQTEGAITL